MSQRHVPAWKRLGLKLKNASEEVPPQVEPTLSNGADGKRKLGRLDDHTASSTPISAKRPRLEDTADKASAEEVEEINSIDISHGQLHRKKSVTFSQDTKVDDGNTAQTITTSVVDPQQPLALNIKRKKEKPVAKKAITQNQPKKTRDALDYLTQHYGNRPKWKFNKSREIWILKHALDEVCIPADCNAALAGYFHGLKSKAARTRLIEKCRHVLDSEVTTPGDSDLNSCDSATFKPRFMNELEKDGFSASQDDELKLWIKRQPRPNIILWSLGEEPTEQRTQGRSASISATPRNGLQRVDFKANRIKKSKARTSRIEFDSSSSNDTCNDEDSDSSDSESEEESSLASSSSSEDVSSSDDSSSSDDTTLSSSSLSSSASSSTTSSTTTTTAISSGSGSDSD